MIGDNDAQGMHIPAQADHRFRRKPITVPGQADHFRPPCGCRFFPTPTRRITATPWHPLRLFSEGSVHGLYEVINAQDTRDLTAASQRSPIQPGHCPQSETVTGDGERLPGSSPGSGGELATARDDDGHRCGAGAVPTTTARLAHTPAARVGHRTPGTQRQRRHADVVVGGVQSRAPQRGDVLRLL